jgi:hypothetical protein
MRSSRSPVKLRMRGSRSSPVAGPYRAGTPGLIEKFARAGARSEFVKGPRQIDRDQGRPAARPRRTMNRGGEEAIRQGQAAGVSRLS